MATPAAATGPTLDQSGRLYAIVHKNPGMTAALAALRQACTNAGITAQWTAFEARLVLAFGDHDISDMPAASQRLTHKFAVRFLKIAAQVKIESDKGGVPSAAAVLTRQSIRDEVDAFLSSYAITSRERSKKKTKQATESAKAADANQLQHNAEDAKTYQLHNSVPQRLLPQFEHSKSLSAAVVPPVQGYAAPHQVASYGQPGTYAPPYDPRAGHSLYAGYAPASTYSGYAAPVPHGAYSGTHGYGVAPLEHSHYTTSAFSAHPYSAQHPQAPYHHGAIVPGPAYDTYAPPYTPAASNEVDLSQLGNFHAPSGAEEHHGPDDYDEGYGHGGHSGHYQSLGASHKRAAQRSVFAPVARWE
ncbi:hypothetical protein JCM10908_002693 [Rhodotorula pacifica]|uniref:uncharacterized protein n=1 Tax=Rhodotorula pacifica TaxID=1495444 RepID=UPI00316C3271